MKRLILSIAVMLTAFLSTNAYSVGCYSVSPSYTTIVYYGTTADVAFCQQIPTGTSGTTLIWYDANYGQYGQCYGINQTTGLNTEGPHGINYDPDDLDGNCTQQPIACNTTSGDEIRVTTKTSTDGQMPQTMVFNGCNYTYKTGTAGVCINKQQDGTQDCIGTYIGDGTDQATQGNPDTGTATPDNGCAIDSSGKQYCIDNSTQNCGKINDTHVCVDDIPATGECTLLPGGSFICEGSTQPPVTQSNGEQIPQQGEIQSDGKTGTIYGNQTGNSSAGGQSGDGTVTVDETGTPDGTGVQGVDTSSLDGHITGIGTTAPTPQDPVNTLTLGTQGTCNANQFDFTFRSIGLNIDVCTALDYIRGALWYFFAGLTIIYLMNLWTVTIKDAK